MAIVINANDGTISGVAVGGLPDGIVDAGTLATNSVDSAELIDGSIDTAHIGTDQITSAILPAGSVLQVAQNSYATEATISSTSLVTTQLAASITPSSTSNKILVMAQVHHIMACAAAEDGGFGWAIYQDDVLQWQTPEPYATYTYGGSNELDHVRDYVFLHYLDTAGTTSNTTYTIFCRRHSGTSTIQVHGNNHESIITLMEIAG